MRERTVEAYLVSEIARIRGETYKWRAYDVKGVPERIIFFRGHKELAEVKKPKGGVLSSCQQREHKRINAQGVVVWILWSFEDVDTFIHFLLGLDTENG